MNKERLLHNLIKGTTVVVAYAGLILVGGQAVAGCGTAELGSPAAKPMLYRNGGTAGLFRTDFEPFYTSAITGLWKFVFTAQGNMGAGAPSNALPIPDGALVDAGFVTWHDDGTELMNSGRAPSSGSFCMGVWKQIGPGTYKLNHWALSWIPDYQPGTTDSWSQIPGGTDELFKALGPANIQETISLINNGNGYKGMFRLTQYVNDGTKSPINNTTGAPVAFVILGNVTATRVTVQ